MSEWTFVRAVEAVRSVDGIPETAVEPLAALIVERMLVVPKELAEGFAEAAHGLQVVADWLKRDDAAAIRVTEGLFGPGRVIGPEDGVVGSSPAADAEERQELLRKIAEVVQWLEDRAYAREDAGAPLGRTRVGIVRMPDRDPPDPDYAVFMYVASQILDAPGVRRAAKASRLRYERAQKLANRIDLGRGGSAAPQVQVSKAKSRLKETMGARFETAYAPKRLLHRYRRLAQRYKEQEGIT